MLSLHPFARLVLVFGGMLTLISGRGNTQQPTIQMKAQAQRAALRPMKLDVHILNRGTRVGTAVPIEVVLLDANNNSSTWERATTVQITITSPSGAVQTQKLTIPAGQSVAQFNFVPSEPGLISLNATDLDNTLRPGANSLLVNRAVTKTAKQVKHGAVFLYGPSSRPRLLEVKATTEGLYLDTDKHPDQPASSTSSDAPTLLITKESGKDEILADGKDFARLQVFFMDPNGNPAPGDINIWLAWSNGELHPNPLVIRKGQTAAEAQWTSKSPVKAKMTLVSVAPKYSVAAGNELDVTFVPAIYGVGTPSPNPLKLSLIDAAPLTAQFFDQDGHAIQTDRVRKITFISSNPSLLHLDPETQAVQANESGASIYLIPTWRGKANLDIWTPGYDYQRVTVEVSIWLVLVMCLVGGVLGGIAAWARLRGSVLWRSFFGIVGAVVLVWSIGYAVLPRTHSVVAHNLISVFVLSIIGGYGGTEVLDWAVKRFAGSKGADAAA
jgi:hypothetical protein